MNDKNRIQERYVKLLKQLLAKCNDQNEVFILRGYEIKQVNDHKIEDELKITFDSEKDAIKYVKDSMHWKPDLNIY